MASCKNCGRELDDVPEADYCSQCPPRRCEQCGEIYSMSDLCKCWVSIEDMAPADIKALFAMDGTFNVEADGSLTVPKGLAE